MSVTPTTQPRGAFASLAIPDYRILWWSGIFSFMSVQMQFLLRGILAWDLTLRESSVGLVYFVFGLSMLITTPLGGVAADRYPKRTILFFSQAAIALAAVGMGFVVVTGRERFWMLLVAAVFQGGSFGFLGPARVAFSSQLVGREYIGNAISLAQLSMNGTRIFAPSLAGALAGIAFFGIGGAYLVAGACSLISFILQFWLPNPPGTSTSKNNPFQEIVNGVRYVNTNRRTGRLVLMSIIVVMFGFNYVSFMPVFVKDVLKHGNAWVGYFSSAGAVGAVMASLYVASRADGPRARTLMFGSGIAFGALVIALGALPGIWLAFGVMVLLGGASTAFQSLSSTIGLLESDPAFQGRVQSLMQLAFAGFGLAALPLGRLAEAITLRGALVVMGAITVTAVLVYGYFERRDGPDSHATLVSDGHLGPVGAKSA